jgi:hypothetical protein
MTSESLAFVSRHPYRVLGQRLTIGVGNRIVDSTWVFCTTMELAREVVMWRDGSSVEHWNGAGWTAVQS